jgi:hypothetical protein
MGLDTLSSNAKKLSIVDSGLKRKRCFASTIRGRSRERMGLATNSSEGSHQPVVVKKSTDVSD